MSKALEKRRQAVALLAAAETIQNTAAGENRAMTADELTAFNAKLAEHDQLQTEATALEGLERRQAAAGKRPEKGTDPRQAGNAPAEGDAKFSITKFLRGLKTGNWRNAETEQAHMEALLAGSDTSGGYTVPTEVSGELIEMLRAEAQVFQAGARYEPMNSDTKVINKLTGGVSVAWVGEQEDTDESALKFGQVRLVTKKCMALVPISNELLEDGDASNEANIRQDISKAMGLETDRVALYGGGGKEPLGLKNIAAITAAAAAVALGALGFDHTKKVKKLIRIKDAGFNGWVMHPEIWEQLNDLKDGEGHPLINAGFAFGNGDSLHGYPVRETTKAKVGTTGTIFGGNWRDLIIGVRKQLSFAISEHVYFTKDTTLIRAIMRMDCVVRHAESFKYQDVTGLTA